MSSALVAALIAVLGVAVTVGVAVLRRRHVAHRQLGGAVPFRCKARLELGEAPGLRTGYRRRWQRAAWVHDVLLLEHGWLSPRLVPHGVESTGTLEASDEGLQLASLRVHLDDGAVIRLTANVRDRTALVGPFLMAELAAPPNNRLMRGNR
jgi:hypothetical protein